MTARVRHTRKVRRREKQPKNKARHALKGGRTGTANVKRMQSLADAAERVGKRAKAERQLTELAAAAGPTPAGLLCVGPTTPRKRPKKKRAVKRNKPASVLSVSSKPKRGPRIQEWAKLVLDLRTTKGG